MSPSLSDPSQLIILWLEQPPPSDQRDACTLNRVVRTIALPVDICHGMHAWIVKVLAAQLDQ